MNNGAQYLNKVLTKHPSKADNASPLVSIVIPSFNRADLIEETLDSISAQTYSNWECIIVDDGSDDDTAAIVGSYVSSDSRLSFVHRQRQPSGASTCRNIGLSLAVGKYVIFLDSDDLLASTCLEHRVALMEQNQETDFIVFPTMVFRDVPGDSPYFWNAFSDEDDFDRFLRFDSPWQTAGPIWRRSSLDRVGFWDESAWSWQDWEFHVRALAEGLIYVKIPHPDSYYRQTRPNAISTASKKRQYKTNRSRVLSRVLLRVATRLKDRDAFTPHRRRFLAAVYYKFAFSYDLSTKKSMMVWCRARQSRVIGPVKYQIGLICLQLFVRIPWRFRGWFFPELSLLNTGKTHMKATAPVLQETEADDIIRDRLQSNSNYISRTS